LLLRLAVGLAAVLPGVTAEANDWRISRRQNGLVVATLFSVNSMSSGTRPIDYHPELTLSCDPDRDPVWRQSIQSREAISGVDGVDVTVMIDNGNAMVERWSLGQKNRALVRDGSESIARLLGARRLRVSWRLGFFSGDGVAVYELGAIRNAVGQLSAACQVPPL